MKKTITAITLMIFLLATALAINIIAGENTTFDIGTTNEVSWSVIGNSSSMDGMTLIQVGSNITIAFDLLYQPDSFTLIFFEPETKEIIKEVSIGGGGSSKTNIIYKNNTIYQDRNIETIKTEYVDRDVNLINLTDDLNNIKQSKNILWLFLIIFIFFLCIVTIVIIYNKTKSKEERTWSSIG